MEKTEMETPQIVEINLDEILKEAEEIEEYKKLRDLAQCQQLAESLNCETKVAEPNQLFIDIDKEEQYAQLLKQLDLLKKFFPYNSVTTTPSKQGLPRRHVVIGLEQELPQLARVALQAALGSDPVRELLSTVRCLDGNNVPASIFFEPKV